jgi:hypothetical protein
MTQSMSKGAFPFIITPNSIFTLVQQVQIGRLSLELIHAMNVGNVFIFSTRKKTLHIVSLTYSILKLIMAFGGFFLHLNDKRRKIVHKRVEKCSADNVRPEKHFFCLSRVEKATAEKFIDGEM